MHMTSMTQKDMAISTVNMMVIPVGAIFQCLYYYWTLEKRHLWITDVIDYCGIKEKALKERCPCIRKSSAIQYL